jgi:hypothetical protein
MVGHQSVGSRSKFYILGHILQFLETILQKPPTSDPTKSQAKHEIRRAVHQPPLRNTSATPAPEEVSPAARGGSEQNGGASTGDVDRGGSAGGRGAGGGGGTLENGARGAAACTEELEMDPEGVAARLGESAADTYAGSGSRDAAAGEMWDAAAGALEEAAVPGPILTSMCFTGDIRLHSLSKMNASFKFPPCSVPYFAARIPISFLPLKSIVFSDVRHIPIGKQMVEIQMGRNR